MMKAMSPSAALISVDEYLHSSYEPACEYRDGVLRQKPMTTRKHSRAQSRIAGYFYQHYPNFEADTELTVRISETRFLIPDIGVQRLDRIQDPYPTEPIHLCVEVRSPEDRMGEVITKCEEYHAWGVPMVWIIDPQNRAAWEFSSDGLLHEVPADGALTAPEISIPLADVFGGDN